MSLLETIIPVLSGSTLELDIKLKRHLDGSVVMYIQPISGEVSVNASEKEKQLKASLAIQMKVIGSLEEIESDLVEHIECYQSKRNEWEMRVMQLDANINSSDASEQTISKSSDTDKPEIKIDPEVEFEL
jgi:hypothetical protein